MQNCAQAGGQKSTIQHTNPVTNTALLSTTHTRAFISLECFKPCSGKLYEWPAAHGGEISLAKSGLP